MSRLSLPPRSEAYARSDPSEDNAGSVVRPASDVTRTSRESDGGVSDLRRANREKAPAASSTRNPVKDSQRKRRENRLAGGVGAGWGSGVSTRGGSEAFSSSVNATGLA